MSPSDKPVLHMIIDPDLLVRVEDFRFEQRFQSRAAAVSWLLAWALDQKVQPSVNEAARVPEGPTKP